MDRWRQTFFGASRSRLDGKSQDRGELAATVGPTCALSRSQANATYRGCFLEEHSSDRRWEAYDGVVSLGAEFRSDADRSFEKALLNTAPPSFGISACGLLKTL
jgi:hypothetical protein